MHKIAACTNLVAHPAPGAGCVTRLMQATIGFISKLLGYHIFLFALFISDIASLKIVITQYIALS